MEALIVVVQYHEGAEVKRLNEENERLKPDTCLPNAIQIETASSQDIFFYFDKINDSGKLPEPESISVDTCFELCDFIMEKSVNIMTGVVPTGQCVFSTVNRHHPFMSAVLKACEHYEEAVKAKGRKEHVQIGSATTNACFWIECMWKIPGCYTQILKFPTDWVIAAVPAGGSGRAVQGTPFVLDLMDEFRLNLLVLFILLITSI
jgi:hypothetical protein